ncbi:MAG: hypothetical protein Q8O46_01610 [bacterium]|nr:hypothetical protein [bacterium]
MKNKNLKRGFAPFLIIALVAILAVGGGAYVVTKNKNSKTKAEDQRRGDVQYEDKIKTEIKTEENISLDVNTKGSLRSLLGVGKDAMCTFTSTAGGTSSSGTVYISADGSMRGDFTAQTSAGTQTSSMIVKGETSHMWSGLQGVKMNAVNKNTTASPETKTNSNVDLDSQVDYKCGDWFKDESKFVIPTSVQFLDIEAMMKGSTTPEGVDVQGMMKLKGQ